MPILYCVIAKEDLVLVKHAAVAGNFEEVTQSILQRQLQEYAKVTYSHSKYLFHKVLENGISFMCVTDDDFDRSRAFLFLSEIKKRFMPTIGSLTNQVLPYSLQSDFSAFLASEMKRYSDSKDLDPISRVHGQLEEVKDIMVMNVGNVIGRGERVELLLNKTEDLTNASVSFKKSSRNLAQAMFWKNVKLYVIIFGILALIIYIIVSISCGGLLWQNCVG